MTLKDNFHNELKAITGSGPHIISVSTDRARLTCELVEVNPLAYTFNRLALETDTLAGATLDQLREISESLAERLTYLLEPIGPIEVDQEQCVVQMRSNPPQQDDDGTSYYELLVRRGGELALCRFQKQPGDAREPIPALVTGEVLGRLVDDFTAVV